jgi:hypothetical protein
VEEQAFSGCTSLTSLVFRPGLLSVGDVVFNGCTSLTAVVFSAGLLTFGSEVFNDCTGLEYVSLPIGLQIINDDTFRTCTNLKTIILPSTAEVWLNNTFYDCPNLTIYTDAEDYEIFNTNFRETTVICNCTLSEKDTHVVSITPNGIGQRNNQYFHRPYREGFWLAGWRTEYGVHCDEYYWQDYEYIYNYYEYDMFSAPLYDGDTATAIWQHI